ncbi:MAG TPA: DUF4249 family protein [Clostridiales bacterium]|nr:DUF4249 family protein [Clostridiales bacterium]
MKFYIRILIVVSMLVLIVSCETGSSTKYDETLTVFCYAKADSTIDSLYISRTGRVNEPISFDNLGVSGAEIKLYERSPVESDYTLIGTLSEYTERAGIYYLPSSDFPGGFKTGYSYRIEVLHDDSDDIYAETVCPPELTGITVKNVKSDTEMTSLYEDSLATDTVYYERGESFDDLKLISCEFDSLLILAEERMASFRIVPDEICRIDTSFWLEDTTKNVWEDYPIETQIFKDQKKYGQDVVEFYLRSFPVYWYNFYHEGMHTIIFSSTDKVYRAFMESRYGGGERYTNVVNGLGLFTIGNASGARSRYRVYVKSLENKYP